MQARVACECRATLFPYAFFVTFLVLVLCNIFFCRQTLILAHVPPAVSTFDGKTGLYEDDIDRLTSLFTPYREMLSGAFLAHWHTDEFQIMYSRNEERTAVMPMFLNPSVSPVHDNTNPGCVLYVMPLLKCQSVLHKREGELPYYTNNSLYLPLCCCCYTKFQARPCETCRRGSYTRTVDC